MAGACARRGARRQAALREHDGLWAAAREAALEAERHREAEREAAAALAVAAERVEAARAALESEHSALSEAAARCRGGLSVLALDDGQFEGALDRAMGGHDPGGAAGGRG